MPYEILSNAEGCSGYAVVKEGERTPIDGGCHPTLEEAQAHYAALQAVYEDEEDDEEEERNGEEGLTPFQTVLYDVLEGITEEFGLFDKGAGAKGAHYVGESPFKDEGLVCANCVFYEGGRACEIVAGDIAPEGICKFWIISERLIKGLEEEPTSEPIPLESEPEEEPMEYESRAVDISAPEFMRASARRGLRLHEEGYSGDGLKPQTVEDARAMAAGTITERKWRKIAPWIARHIVDLDAVGEGEITAGLVAMLLWGGGSSKESARRAQSYAERVVERLDSRNDVWIQEALEGRAPAPKKDQIKGSDENPSGSAKDKSGSIEISQATETTLKNKVKEHNDRMEKDDKPEWTRVTLGALKAVYRRGAGAFSTSHRPGVGRAQWAMARVNAFLQLSRTGTPKNPNYVSDNDLLNPNHPKYSKSERAVAEAEGTHLEYEDSLETERESSMANEIEVRWVSKSDSENRSVAYTNLELRAEGEGSTLVGYASVFDSPSEPMPFVEYVKRGAFTKTIKDGADVRLLIDHEGVPLARTKSGTLSLQEDERGLRVEANLDPSNPDAARVMSALKRGDLSQMSFAFRTIKDSWNSDRTVRELREVQLYDVSVVTYPAYESTVAELRTANETTNIEPSSFTRLRSKEVARARISQPK